MVIAYHNGGYDSCTDLANIQYCYGGMRVTSTTTSPVGCLKMYATTAVVASHINLTCGDVDKCSNTKNLYVALVLLQFAKKCRVKKNNNKKTFAALQKDGGGLQNGWFTKFET